MATRTRTTSATPAKKTAAKKTTSRRPAKKTAPAVSLTKTTPPPLPTRAYDWMTDAQGFAVLAARMAGIDTDRIQDWRDHGDGTVTRALTDGTLSYKVATRTLRWQATCRMGAVHTYRIDDPSMATMARVRAATCTQLHADLTGIPALTEAERAELRIGHIQARTLTVPVSGVPEFAETIPVPVPGRAERSLADQLTHATSTTADTQPLDVAEVAAGLAARADHDEAKEHPEP